MLEAFLTCISNESNMKYKSAKKFLTKMETLFICLKIYTFIN